MRTRMSLLIALSIILIASSCTTVIQMRKTYPPEKKLPADSGKYVFVNFYDYTLPESIKNKDELAYAIAVRGYIDGLGEIILKDPRASFTIGDTLRNGHTIATMQYPEFADTVKAICSKHKAELLVALDSIKMWIDWDVSLEEGEYDDEGSMLVKEFYLYSNNYMTLYSSDGRVIDRCSGEKGANFKTNYTIFGVFGGAKLTGDRAREVIRTLSHDAAADCINKFYPFTEYVPVTIYTGGQLNAINKMMTGSKPEDALAPLRELARSSDAKTAKKASHNLMVLNEILENLRVEEELYKTSGK